MRKSGDITNKICWKLIIKCNDSIMLEKEFKTLKSISEELGYSYNVISEMALGRKKKRGGKYDTQYLFKKL